MTTNLELYEVLRKHMDDDAAKAIAGALPPSGEIATKGDIERLHLQMDGVQAATTAQIEGLQAATAAQIAGLQAATAAQIEAFKAETNGRFDALALRTEGQIQALRADLKGMEAAIMRWMLTFFATLWLGVAGMIVAIVLKG